MPGIGSLPSIPALTGLRFFAAFFILFSHAGDWLAHFQNAEVRPYLRLPAMYGMPLFFVLSGFVIHYNYRRLFTSKSVGRATSEFAAARFARLAPLYFFLLIVSMLADNFFTEMAGYPGAVKPILLNYLAATQSWFYLVFNGKLIINLLYPLSWSISTEYFFYIAYVPLVLLVFRLISARAALTVAIAYGIGVMLLFIASRYYLGGILIFSQHHVATYIDLNVDFANSFYRWLFYFSPYLRVFEFIMGCLAAQAFVALLGRPVSASEHRLGTIALVAALIVLLLCGMFYANAIVIEPINLYSRHLALNFLYAPAIATVLFCVSRYKTGFSVFMSSTVLVALGDASYSIYLVHWNVLRMFFHPSPPFTMFWAFETVLRVSVAIAMTLIVAYATYRLIEVPGRLWLRRNFARWIAAVFGDGPARAPARAAPVREAAE